METFDYETQFEKVKKDVAAALAKTLDVQAYRTGLRLQAKDIYVDDNSSSGDWEGQRDAVRKDKTWGVPVYGTIELSDRKTGKVISTAKRVKLATLPKPTDFGSFIVDGKHYQVHNQLRRKPGIYITEKENGEAKTEVNIAGRPFDVEFDPQKEVFNLVLRQGESKQVAPLYPVISRLGISDGVLAKAWGEGVLAKNKAIGGKQAANAVKKVAEFFHTGQTFDSPDDASKAIAAYLDEQTEVRPEVTERTIGKAFTKITPESIVMGSQELLKAVDGKRSTDDRHALDYKKAYALSDIMRERFFKPNGELSQHMNDFRRKLERKLDNQRNPPTQVSQLVNPSQFTGAVSSFFTKSELSSTTDQTNPIHMLNGMSKITILGEGGAGDPQRVRAEEHALHPSQLGFIDPVHTPDSEKIGLVMNLPIGVSKKGDDLQTAVYDLKEKKNRHITPSDASRLVVGFPDQFKDGKPVDKKVKAMVNGETQLVDADKVDVVLKTPRQAFSISSNLIPFQPAVAGVRAQMATKMLEQAIPLVHREAPRVQVKLGGQTIEDAIGSGFSVRALDDGTVKSVSKNRVVIATKDGEIEHPLYTNLPLNNKSFVDAQPTVKVGDTVKKGDVVADSNFTKNGTLAIGTNLHAAYIPWKGYNFEDGIVITEAAAKKLTSEHMHQHVHQPTNGAELGLDKFMAWHPGGLDVEQQAKLDPDGVIKKGAILKKGDPLWVGAQEYRFDDPDAVALRRLGGKMGKKPYIEQWTEDHPGEVVDVVRSGKKIKVYVKTKEPAQIGDKLTNRHAAKGIITKIIPDGQAPYVLGPDGHPQHVDILLNPHGIVGRINPSQMMETVTSKLAKVDENGQVTKPYVVENSITDATKYAQMVADHAAQGGVKDTEVLYDPHTNKPLGDILTGPQYFLKLSKQATSQFSARSPMDPKAKYDVHGNPIEGGESGSKALDLISFYSMLSHGARANLQEMATFKATKNQPFWDWLAAGAASGLIKPPPEPTFAYKKFEAYLRAAGVNVKRNGSKMVLQPLTDREVDNLSNGPLKEPVFVRGKDLEEEKGGLMDPIVFGGRKGSNWGHIDLAEPMPNPVFETPIKTLTGLKDAQFKGLVQGKLWLNPETGEMGGPELEKHPDTVTGGVAIKALLSKINVDQDIKDWTDRAKQATTPQKLDEANKRLKYLVALKKLKARPEDVYVQSKIPVLPPQFRPVIEMDDGTLSNAGLNTLYRDTALVNNELKWHNDQQFIPDSMTSEVRQNLYDGMKALAGIGNPIAYYPGSRRPKGVIEQIKGEPAKRGFYQYNILRRRQEPVGRGTIIPEPKLGVDEVGLPEEMAWKIFEPFIMRRLVTNSGLSPIDASKEVEARSSNARSALEAEMKDRPVILNRAPSLHKFSLMAFKPQLTDGRAIKIPPLVVKGFGADFDGDTMTVHVPVLPDAVKEAHGMLPSKNLYNPGTGGVMIQPQNEAALGLFMMSSDPTKRGEVLSVLPPELQAKYKDRVLNKKGLSDLMQDLAAAAPHDYGKVVDKLKMMGDEHTYQSGFTVGLKDLLPNVPEKDKIFEETRKKIYDMKVDTPQGREKAVQLISAANDEVKKILDKRLTEQGNNFHLMVRSGARGNIDQLKQIVSAPVLVDDHKGRPQPVPVLRSFAEGLPLSDYWSTLYGARAAAVDKQLQTSAPGAFNKDIMATSITTVVTHDPHGDEDHDGIRLPLKTNDRDLTDRFLAENIKVGNTVLAHAGDQVSTQLLNTLRDRGVEDIKVRSPLTSRAPKGIYPKDYGLSENGQLPGIGTNVGAIAGQALSEPLTQMTLRTFHSGGVSGTRGAISGYEKIDKLFKMHQIKQGKATLAQRDGKVTKVEDLVGGKNVYLDTDGKDDAPHFIPKDLWEDGKIKVGTKVEAGQILSGGIVQPQELVKLKVNKLGTREGMLEAQNYIVDQIHDAYHKQGVPIKRKVVETVVRSVGNTTKILDPGDSTFIPGEVAPWTEVEAYNKTKHGEVHLDDSLGHTLLEDLPGLKKGEPITDRVKSLLERMGKQKVTVGPKAIVHEPFLAGIERIPILRKDWMSQMGYQNLKDAIVGGAAEAHESDLHGFAPVPAFAYGAEFGEAPGNKSTKEGVY